MRHEFVEHIPEAIEPNVLYIAIEYDVAVHSCFCGCGHEVVTPLSPAQWSLAYDGQSISLSPSIGNWNFPCKSHYWIRRGRIEWGARFSDAKIDAVRAKDRADLEGLIKTKRVPLEQPISIQSAAKSEADAMPTAQVEDSIRKGLFARIFDLFS